MTDLPKGVKKWILQPGLSLFIFFPSVSYLNVDHNRWFAYDTICQLSFGEPLGFVKEGRDIEDLIGNFHKMAPFAAVVGALPWLARPFLENAITRRFAMPKPGDGTGTGKIMAVRPTRVGPLTPIDMISSGTSFSSSDSQTQNLINMAIFSTAFSLRRMPMDPLSLSTK